jgi:hypothetical protein
MESAPTSKLINPVLRTIIVLFVQVFNVLQGSLN